MKMVIVALFALLFLSCDNKKDNFKAEPQKNLLQTSNILGSNELTKILEGEINKYPSELYALYFANYRYDTLHLFFTTVYPSVESIYRERPDQLIQINKKNVLLCLGLSNLGKVDSNKYNMMIKKIETTVELIKKSRGDMWTPRGREIIASRGVYQLKYIIDPSSIPTSRLIRFVPHKSQPKRVK